VNSAQWSMAPLFNEQWSHAPLLTLGQQHEKQHFAASQNLCCFSKPAVQPQILVDPTSKTPCFSFNQTLGSVGAGEPHPQSHYKTATKF
jgi:hypothetical protein